MSEERPSFELKLVRAEEHLDYLDSVLTEYSNERPYRVVEDVKNKTNRRHKTWYAYVTEPPSPWLSVIFGEVVYNIRSALDHLAVALVPRKRRRKASFPIRDSDIWTTDPATGRYLSDDDDGRNAFLTSVKGMPPEAIALIHELQPYKTHPSDPKFSPLALLSAFQNADKHRELIPIAFGLTNIRFSVITDGVRSPVGTVDGVFEYGAKISCALPFAFMDAEMTMELDGTVAVAFDAGHDLYSLRFPNGPREILEWVRESVVTPLASMIRSG